MIQQTMNPYEAPNDSDNADRKLQSITSRFAIVGGEMVIVSAILGALAGLLFPAVEAARNTNGLGPFFPELMWLHERTFPLPILAGSGFFALFTYVAFRLLRSIAPAAMLRYLPWWQKRDTQKSANKTMHVSGRRRRS